MSRQHEEGQSIRERLWREYNNRLENDRPIDPVLDDLLFGTPDDKDKKYEMPILRKVSKMERSNRDVGAVETSPFGPIDSMAPPNSNSDRPEMMGGYDGGFESGFLGEWNSFHFQYTINLMDFIRESESPSKIVKLGDREFVLFPHGGGVGRSYYKYIIEGGGWKIYIHHSPKGDIQPIRVRFGMEALCGRSLFDVHEEFVAWCKSIGFHLDVDSEKISRFDMQCMFKRPVSDFVRPVANECVVMRAKTGQVYFDCRVPTSFCFGTNIRIRVYDKRKELFDTLNELGLEMISEYCCGGEIPDYLTRVEFQLRREVLDWFKINTIADLKACERSLVEWLTCDWFRITEGQVDRSNTTRQKVSELWQEVQAAFLRWFPGGDTNRELTRKDRKLVGLNCKADDLVRQAAGCFASVIARTAGFIRDKKQILAMIIQRVEQYLDRIKAKTAERANHFMTVTGYYHDLDLEYGLQEKNDRSIDPRFAMSESCIPDRGIPLLAGVS